VVVAVEWRLEVGGGRPEPAVDGSERAAAENGLYEQLTE
jgi:hypothetical protein